MQIRQPKFRVNWLPSDAVGQHWLGDHVIGMAVKVVFLLRSEKMKKINKIKMLLCMDK